MEFAEAKSIAHRVVSQYKAFEKMEEVLNAVVNAEASAAAAEERRKKAVEEAERAKLEAHQAVHAAGVEAERLIKVAKADKAQIEEATEKVMAEGEKWLADHAEAVQAAQDEHNAWLTAVGAEREKLEGEIADLTNTRDGLVEALQKLRKELDGLRERLGG